MGSIFLAGEGLDFAPGVEAHPVRDRLFCFGFLNIPLAN
jgi:hypothetical protein